MKNLKFFFCLFISMASVIYGACFDKDTTLIESLAASNIRLVVLCNYQGTNNLLNIVTSSRSPGYNLTEVGLAQLQNTIPTFAAENVSYIFTAPAYRALQSTNLIGNALGLPINHMALDSRLGMQNFGSQEGQNFNAYKLSFGTTPNMLKGTPTGGESGCDVYTRTDAFLNSLLVYPNETILIITHAFNYCHISNILTGSFGSVPATGTYRVYDFNQP